MTLRRTRAIQTAGLVVTLLIASAAYWRAHPRPQYLPADTGSFVAMLAAPPAAGSPQARAELDELMALQASRSDADVEAARADRRKDIDRFYGALGIDPGAPPALAELHSFTDRVENDVSIYVRAAKHRFGRSRPYVIETRLKPCIGDVADDQSYPSGHASYGYAMGYLLGQMVPERRAQLTERADEFAHHRMVCGVHFASDLEAGKISARWLLDAMRADRGFVEDSDAATHELRAALRLPQQPAAAAH